MKKGLKRALCLLTAALLLSVSCFAASNLPKLDKGVCVVDDADILSSETETYVTDLNAQLTEACGAQIGVLTVEFTGNSTTEQYAYDAANAWGIGDAQKNNGVLLLLVPGADDYFCVQGSGITGTLPTSTLSAILQDHMEDNWVAGDFDAGVQETVAQIAGRLCDIYGVSLNGSGQQGSYNDYDDYDDYNDYNDEGGSLFGAVITLIVVIVIVAVVLNLFSGGGRGSGGGYGGGGGGGWLFPFMMGRWTSGGGYRRYYNPPPPPPRGPRPPRPPHGGGFGGGGFGGGGFGGMGGGSFGGGGFGGGGFGGMGGGSFGGGGAGRGR